MFLIPEESHDGNQMWVYEHICFSLTALFEGFGETRIF